MSHNGFVGVVAGPLRLVVMVSAREDLRTRGELSTFRLLQSWLPCTSAVSSVIPIF